MTFLSWLNNNQFYILIGVSILIIITFFIIKKRKKQPLKSYQAPLSVHKPIPSIYPPELINIAGSTGNEGVKEEKVIECVNRTWFWVIIAIVSIAGLILGGIFTYEVGRGQFKSILNQSIVCSPPACPACPSTSCPAVTSNCNPQTNNNYTINNNIDNSICNAYCRSMNCSV